MIKLASKKTNIICAVMAVILLISIIDSVLIHNQIQELKDQEIKQYYDEWYEIFQMSKNIEQYLNEDSVNGEKYALYVNNVCYHLRAAVSPSELISNLSFLLVTSYDPLFNNLAKEKETLNRDKAIDLLKKMNGELFTISKNIIETEESQKKELLDQSSTRYEDVNARVSDFSNRYTKLVDEYFRAYTK